MRERRGRARQAGDAVRLTLLGDLAVAAGRILMVGHVFRHNAAITHVRHMLARGEIGDLLYQYFTRTNLRTIRSGVNVVWDLMSHDVSIALHFLNRLPDSVSAQGACYSTLARCARSQWLARRAWS